MIESISKDRLEELIAFHNTRAVMALAPEERRYHEDSHAAWLELLRLRDCEFVVNEMHGIAKDAARYRWLKSQVGELSPAASIVWRTSAGNWANTASARHLDSAIDAQMTP